MECTCAVCENDFSLRAREKEKLIFRKNPDVYICHTCYEERITSEFRLVGGSYLCSNKNCVRNRMVLSIFCEICDNHDGFFYSEENIN